MTNLAAYILKRSVSIILTLFIISVVIFGTTQVLPGNVAEMMLGQYATPESVAALEEQFGLNRPLHVRYFEWVSGFVTGNLGMSYFYERPIAELLVPRFIASLQLAAVATVLVTAISVPLGVLGALKKDSRLDTSLSIVSYIGISVPEFVTGGLLILLFAGPVFSIFPTGGHVTLSQGVLPWFMHLFLPALTLSIILLAHMFRLTRSEMIDVLESEYIKTARLKGLPELAVIKTHALRNALAPAITVLGMNIGWLMGGIVIVEEVFSYPGIGRLVVLAIQHRDVPLIQATVMVIAVMYALANFGTDIVYTYLDPRISYGGDE